MQEFIRFDCGCEVLLINESFDDAVHCHWGVEPPLILEIVEDFKGLFGERGRGADARVNRTCGGFFRVDTGVSTCHHGCEECESSA